jgi:hypothetical protein
LGNDSRYQIYLLEAMGLLNITTLTFFYFSYTATLIIYGGSAANLVGCRFGCDSTVGLAASSTIDPIVGSAIVGIRLLIQILIFRVVRVIGLLHGF